MSMLSKRLKFLRKEKGVNQKKLGDFLGYGYSAISNYESGRNEPSLDILIKIADYFEVSTDYLLGRAINNSEEIKNIFYKIEKLPESEKIFIYDIINLCFNKAVIK
ncbi:hypothetical protein B5E58_11370 [Tyzzerella sp. An114]|uniref:helix-turn-helix domain-containing protein n=1 Tax=Tyzzerella sp. An114 TaxID=1965545 RepID=UPI000B4311A7|nr:helix-turn-helix transcriptional regulator [Tyzzerella sp. An114]OUQ56006.1 hypothetical protein B5E58_11370 [Tyzzerella sp. An114]HIT72312.1 helix-turn-helix transcriptional regulator [Candidatus Fimicola cottocaccae]